MAYRKPRHRKLEINDLTVLTIWLLFAYLIYKADPERSREAFNAMSQIVMHFLPSSKLFKNRSGHHRAVAFSRPLKHERRIE